MSEDRGLLRAISWHECFPWFIIFRATLIGFYLRVIFLAYLGVCLMHIGVWVGQNLFAPPAGDPIVLPGLPLVYLPGLPLIDDALVAGTTSVRSVPGVWSTLVEPFRALFQPAFSLRGFAYALFLATWYTATWALFGGAISRIAALEFSINDRCGMLSALGHAGRKFLGYFLSPLFPLIGVFLLLLVITLFGLINYLGTWAAVATGIFGFVVVLCALASSLLLVPLLLGWPLMWGAVSTECSDHFDALSRCYAYTTQRPFQYLGYVLVAVFAGGVGVFAAALLAGVAKHMLFTGLAWGQGTSRTEQILTHAVAGPIWNFWFLALDQIVTAYAFGFFFAVAAAIYLLLRRDVDQAELDEIVQDDNRARYAMPTLDKQPEPDSPGRESEPDKNGEAPTEEDSPTTES